MTTTQRRKLITVPRGPHATVKAIEKSGLVNITSTGITEVTGQGIHLAIVELHGESAEESQKLAFEMVAPATGCCSSSSRQKSSNLVRAIDARSSPPRASMY